MGDYCTAIIRPSTYFIDEQIIIPHTHGSMGLQQWWIFLIWYITSWDVLKPSRGIKRRNLTPPKIKDTQNDGPWKRWLLFNIACFGIYMLNFWGVTSAQDKPQEWWFSIQESLPDPRNIQGFGIILICPDVNLHSPKPTVRTWKWMVNTIAVSGCTYIWVICYQAHLLREPGFTPLIFPDSRS